MSARISAWVPEPADLDGAPAEVALHAIPREGPLPPAVRDAEFLVAPHAERRVLEALRDMPRLRVVQAMSAGVEWLLPHVPPHVTVCTARGAYDVAVAEWVVAGMLADAKRLSQFRDRQRERRWEHAILDEVAGRQALIVGLGSIGREVAARLEALGVSVQGVARRARPAVAATAD
nr:dehydrogenase [Actinomycetota bacterium]